MGPNKPGPKAIKLFPCSTQLSTKFILLINVKMPTIVGILTFTSMINTTSARLTTRNFFICRYFSFYEQLKFLAQLSWAWKKFYNLGVWSLVLIITLPLSGTLILYSYILRQIIVQDKSYSSQYMRFWYFYHMGLGARKPVFGLFRTTKVQTSLHISVVWSAPSFFAFWKVSYPSLLQVKFQLSS